MLEQIIKDILDKQVPGHMSSEIYQYAVFPPGKLFRPKLVQYIYEDFTFQSLEKSSDHALLLTAIELHHAYTLVHDDLPSMDNDDLRRGKDSTHIKYGDANAILIGDGLLAISYALFSQMRSQNKEAAFRFFSWATGPKGIILGQILDLEAQKNKRTLSFHEIIEIHKLKTSRLIQAALCSSFLLLTDEELRKSNCCSLDRYQVFKKLFRLGNDLGISFQLIDDFNELTKEISFKEKLINSYVQYPKDHKNFLASARKRIESLFSEYELPKLQRFIQDYLK